jgi:hypothetical protein
MSNDKNGEYEVVSQATTASMSSKYWSAGRVRRHLQWRE